MTRIKQIRPSVLTIFGGVHVTVLAYLRFYLGPRIISYNLKRAGFKATVINMFAFVRSNLASLLENITPRKPRSVTSKGTAY